MIVVDFLGVLVFVELCDIDSIVLSVLMFGLLEMLEGANEVMAASLDSVLLSPIPGERSMVEAKVVIVETFDTDN